jgi:hypothetical protein
MKQPSELWLIHQLRNVKVSIRTFFGRHFTTPYLTYRLKTNPPFFKGANMHKSIKRATDIIAGIGLVLRILLTVLVFPQTGGTEF